MFRKSLYRNTKMKQEMNVISPHIKTNNLSLPMNKAKLPNICFHSTLQKRKLICFYTKTLKFDYTFDW